VDALVKHLLEDSLSSLFPQERTEALGAMLPTAGLPEQGFQNDEIGSMLSEIEAMPEQELRTMFTGRKSKSQGAV
jgi:hypothetical protein